jgi:hypothetical protein
MKLRFILTAIVVAIFHATNFITNLYYSPMTGTLTANTLNGDSNDYAIARFVQNGGLTAIFGIITVVAIVLIWWTPIFGKTNKQ